MLWPMMGHKICFYEKICLMIPKLSQLPLLIWSTDDINIIQPNIQTEKRINIRNTNWILKIYVVFVKMAFSSKYKIYKNFW